MRGQFDSFFAITGRWHLTQSEKRALLGSPSDERWHEFVHRSVTNITPEEFARMHALGEIDAALSLLVNDPRDAARWFRTLEMSSPFFGRTPLAMLFRGMQGFKSVADYLAARRPASHVRNALRQ